MKWIKYQISCNEEKGILLTKKLEFSVNNLDIAYREAYNGSYEIVDDEKHSENYFNKQPLAVEFGGTGCKSKEDILLEFGIIPTFEDEDYPGCYYRMIDGEKEWINPPMIHNAEYRTIERWNGKPVYVKAGYDAKINNNSVVLEGLWIMGITIAKTSTLIEATGTVNRWTSSTLFYREALVLGENLLLANGGDVRFKAREEEASQDYTDFIVTLKYVKSEGE